MFHAGSTIISIMRLSSPATDSRAAHPEVRLVLASESPRRAELLREHGFRFEVIRPSLSEPACLPGCRTPTELAEALSYFKARSVVAEIMAGIILAADTITALGSEIFGKPRDRGDAARMLTALAGTTHQVITGVTVLDAGTRRRRVAHDVTEVRMVAMSESELEAYLDTNAWMGKAGAYGIQDHGDRFVAACRGSFTNVVGLPMELVGEMLAEFGCRPGLVSTTVPMH